MPITIGNTKVEGRLTPSGNGVLLSPLAKAKVSTAGIHIPDERIGWQFADAIEWKVLSVGPGARKLDKKGRPKGPVIPITDVGPGDCVICNVSNGCFQLDDGTGRVIVQADQLLMSWKPEVNPAHAFGGDQT